METTNPSSAMLCNYEVLTLLQELKSKQMKNMNAQSPLATIIYETTRYLQEMPCSLQTAQCVQKFLKAMIPFKLTKAEKLMILNNPPSTPLEVQVMVEESEERLTEDDVARLLETVKEHLPLPPQPEAN